MKISDKNSKLGKIPNISLIPVKDCANCEHCKSSCYALKAWKQYPAVRKAWKENSKEWRTAPFAAAESFLEYWAGKKKQPRFFRIHVAGDFLEQLHVNAWIFIASRMPDTKFLAFTKRHDLDYSGRPDNLTIVLSQWPGMPLPDDMQGLRSAWMQDGTENRVPADAIECPGNCESCGMCWHLPMIGKDVFFNEH